MVASDKLFYWLFQKRPDRIVQLLEDLPADAGGYRFSAPVLKERECRLDGLFLPPQERPDLPAVVLEAQMAADPDFLRRLYAECALLLRQEPAIQRWQVVVLCPSRQLNFGDPEPLAEFVEHRLRWLELQPTTGPVEEQPLLQRVLALLLQSEEQIPAATRQLRQQASSGAWAAELDEVIAAILVARFPSRSIPQLCAMGGITIEDFTESPIYKEIVGIGRIEGRAEGRAEGEAAVTLRQLNRRCGPLSEATTARIQALPLEKLEALAEALLDFGGMDDLNSWLVLHG